MGIVAQVAETTSVTAQAAVSYHFLDCMILPPNVNEMDVILLFLHMPATIVVFVARNAHKMKGTTILSITKPGCFD